MKTYTQLFIFVALIFLTACSFPESPGLIGDTLRGFTNTCSLTCPSSKSAFYGGQKVENAKKKYL